TVRARRGLCPHEQLHVRALVRDHGVRGARRPRLADRRGARGRGAHRGARAAARIRRVAHGAVLAADHHHDASATAGAARIARAGARAAAPRARAPRAGAVMALLELAGITVRFGGVVAISRFDLRVDAGALVAMIGPNGAGKTTGFNVITGVCAPTEGSVSFDGERIDGLSAHEVCRRGIARTFQNIRLFRSLTALENVLAAGVGARRDGQADVLRGAGWQRREDADAAAARELLRRLGLERFADARADALPYGEQRRLEIARALATRPRLLLLDEPAAGMNPSEKEALRALIVQLHRDFELS